VAARSGYSPCGKPLSAARHSTARHPSSKPNNTKTMSKSQFITKAPEIAPLISGQSIAATAKKFSTGSVGYNLNGKVTLADGTRLQVTGNAIVIGSKEWSE
jgi:hypothetical protein